MEKQTNVEMENQSSIVKVLCMGNNYDSPCTFPLTLKLQTYLRMADIKYEVVSCVMSSSKGKIPYVDVDGQKIEGTTNIINFLNSQFGKDLNAHLSGEEIKQALEFQEMIEKSLQWSLEYQRWMLDENIAEKFPLTNFFFRFIFKMMLRYKLRPELQQEMQEHGMGSYTQEELIQFAEKQLTSLSKHLGDHPYFMGKEASEVDATVFGFVGLLLEGMKSSASQQFVTSHLPNLVSYVERMKEKYWPDWEELCSEGKQQKESCKFNKKRNPCDSHEVSTVA